MRITFELELVGIFFQEGFGGAGGQFFQFFLAAPCQLRAAKVLVTLTWALQHIVKGGQLLGRLRLLFGGTSDRPAFASAAAFDMGSCSSHWRDRPKLTGKAWKDGFPTSSRVHRGPQAPAQ